jgi:hypothetical protein
MWKVLLIFRISIGINCEHWVLYEQCCRPAVKIAAAYKKNLWLQLGISSSWCGSPPPPLLGWLASTSQKWLARYCPLSLLYSVSFRSPIRLLFGRVTKRKVVRVCLRVMATHEESPIRSLFELVKCSDFNRNKLPFYCQSLTSLTSLTTPRHHILT